MDKYNQKKYKKYAISILTGGFLEERLTRINAPYFNYAVLMDLYGDFKSPKAKITKLIRGKDIIKVKRDLYVLGKHYKNSFLQEALANIIYGPSYVSLEYALFRFGLIPEKVFNITSVCMKKNKLFKTPFGTFKYQYIKDPIYHIGIDFVQSLEGNYYIATKEKALCDLAYFNKTARSLLNSEEGIRFLLEDYRMDPDDLRELDEKSLIEISKIYKRRSVLNITDAVLRIKHG